MKASEEQHHIPTPQGKVLGELLSKASNCRMVSLDDINASKSLSEYGMDSLVAVVTRNRLLRELNVALPVLELLPKF